MEEVYIKCENIVVEVKAEPIDTEESCIRIEKNTLITFKSENNISHEGSFNEVTHNLCPNEKLIKDLHNVTMPNEKPDQESVDVNYNMPEESQQTLANLTMELEVQGTSQDIGRVYENGKINRLNCNQCGKSFKNRANLKNHLKFVHAEDQTVECTECLRSFKSMLYLRSHMSSVHAKTELVECEHCQKVFLNKKKLNNHIYYTHRQPEEQVACKVCSKTFKGPYNLKIHMRYVHPEGDPHPCPFCYKTFKVEMLLHRHMKWAHPDDGMVYKCQECYKILPSMDGYRTHMKNVHLFNRATCDLCKRTFKTKKSLERHMKNIHNGKNNTVIVYTPKDHTCEFCQRTFNNTTSLFWHIERYHAQDQKLPNTLCILCHKEFSDYAALHRHLTSVHSLETATCKICLKEFKSPINLQNHIRITHAPPEAIQTCETCKKTFKCALHLRMHVLAVHDGGQYPCDLCQKTFASIKYLNKHKKSHNQSRDFQCDICFKMYKNINAVNKHKKLVHNSIKCTICNIKQVNIEEHFKKYHSDVALNLSMDSVTNKSMDVENDVSTKEINIEEITCNICEERIDSLDYNVHVSSCKRPPILEVTIKTEIHEET